MKITTDKDVFLRAVSLAFQFTSQKTSSPQILQGVLLKGKNNQLDFYSCNLNNFFHTRIKAEIEKETTALIDPQKMTEFLTLLQPGTIDLDINEKMVAVVQAKTKGSFPLMNPADFPFPPKISGSEQKTKTKTFIGDISAVLFSSAKDEGRPVLKGVNFVADEDLTIATTDGFRLSLIKTKKQIDHPSLIIPADFLEELSKMAAGNEEMGFVFLESEKMVVFKFDQTEIYSRLIEGEFPPYEKVIPEKCALKITVEKEDLLRAIKLISIFAKEQSNIIVFGLEKDNLIVRPKNKEGGNMTLVEAKSEGKAQTIAFNYRFLLDFLNHVDGEKKKIVVEILRPDAPVVFRVEGEENHLHVIMPVRIQE